MELTRAERAARADDDRHAVSRSQVFYNYAYPLSTLAVGLLSVVPVLVMMNRLGQGGGFSPRERQQFRRAERDRFARTQAADVVAEAEATIRRAERRGPPVRPEQAKARKGLYDAR